MALTLSTMFLRVLSAAELASAPGEACTAKHHGGCPVRPTLVGERYITDCAVRRDALPQGCISDLLVLSCGLLL